MQTQTSICIVVGLQPLTSDQLADEVVNNVVETLRLTGRRIEDEHGSAGLTAVFARLNEIRQTSRTLSAVAKRNIRQLPQLRGNQWRAAAKKRGSIDSLLYEYVKYEKVIRSNNKLPCFRSMGDMRVS